MNNFYSFLACMIFTSGGARSKGFATVRNVSKLPVLTRLSKLLVGQAKSVGFRFYSAI